MLEKLVASGNSIAAVFSSSRDHGIGGIRDIHKLCVNLDVPMLHVLGQVCEVLWLVYMFSLKQEGPERLGIESDPSLVYYEKEVPAVFEGKLDSTDSGG